MCGGVYYSYGGRATRVYFPNPAAMLPVRTRSGETTLLSWGRRNDQAGQLPLGGWARLDTIYAGRWDRWFPVPVKLDIRSFMERDFEGHSHWYDLTRGQWVQGLVARYHHERRVYVVTVTPEMPDTAHERWPRILSGYRRLP
jgi:hypothetical protein